MRLTHVGNYGAPRRGAARLSFSLDPEHFLMLTLRPDDESAAWIGHDVGELDLPASCQVALVQRQQKRFVPGPYTQLQEGDRLIIIGEASGIRALRQRFPSAWPASV